MSRLREQPATCTATGCSSGPCVARGLCKTHYWRALGAARKAASAALPRCQREDCRRPVRSGAFCGYHARYERGRRGRPAPTKPAPPAVATHVESWRRQGKPNPSPTSAGRIPPEGARRLRQYAAKLELAAQQMLEAASDARHAADWLERGV